MYVWVIDIKLKFDPFLAILVILRKIYENVNFTINLYDQKSKMAIYQRKKCSTRYICHLQYPNSIFY